MNILKKTVIYILTIESKLVLRKYKPTVIAVTGSVGKTSTKDAIYTVLASAGDHVRKNEKSFNSKIGIPLTILGVPNAWHSSLGWFSNMLHGIGLVLLKADYPKTLILEAGADHPGDIETLVKWLRPDVAVITKIDDIPVHVEFFKSPAEVFKEKIFLAKGVRSGDTVVLFADDEKMKNLDLGPDKKVITYGMGNSSAIVGSYPLIVYKKGKNGTEKPDGMTFKLDYEGNSVPIVLSHVLGAQHIYPILAAVAVGLDRGVTLVKILESVSDYEAPLGRMNLIEGINDSTIIDDSYNSSPIALAHALATLAEVTGAQRKIAILGDMMELGSYSAAEHKKAGVLVAKSLDASRGDILVTVGQRAKGIKEGVVSAGMNHLQIISFNDSIEAAEKVKGMVKAGDVILVKGSQSPRMERITKALLADPSRAEELLVRQEKEWLEKK